MLTKDNCTEIDEWINFDSLKICIRPLRQHSLPKLTNSKLAIINVSISPKGKWNLFTLRRNCLTHHHGLISSEFQTGNSSIILQKWQCEVWSCRDTHIMFAISDIVIDMLWLMYKKTTRKNNGPIDYSPKNCLRIQAQVKFTYVSHTQSQGLRYSSRFEPILIR